MRKSFFCLAPVLVAATASAQVVSFRAFLTGANEAPNVADSTIATKTVTVPALAHPPLSLAARRPRTPSRARRSSTRLPLPIWPKRISS